MTTVIFGGECVMISPMLSPNRQGLEGDLPPGRLVPAPAGGRRGVAQLPPPGGTPNPYAELLYAALAAQGLPRASFPALTASSLWRSRRTIRFLHFHWRPDRCYAPCLGHYGRSGFFRVVQAVGQLCRFAFRLAWARLLRYRIVWTVHEVWPPRHAGIDRAGHALLARASSVLLAHSAAMADRLRAELRRPLSIEIVPHGTYRNVYPVVRARADVRAELGLPADAFVFLCFGQLRADKQTGFLLDAFAAIDRPDVYLLIAGQPAHGPSRRRIERAAKDDDRIRVLLEKVPHERVGELFAMADAFVLARSEVWTSGSLVLALSLGLPAVAARMDPVVELIGDGEAGWLFAPDEVDSLARALRSAAGDRVAAARKRAAARERGARLPTWEEVADRTARLLEHDGARSLAPLAGTPALRREPVDSTSSA
jgi:glycosyltransferase involved in cell wall biosynthesis